MSGRFASPSNRSWGCGDTAIGHQTLTSAATLLTSPPSNLIFPTNGSAAPPSQHNSGRHTIVISPHQLSGCTPQGSTDYSYSLKTTLQKPQVKRKLDLEPVEYNEGFKTPKSTKKRACRRSLSECPQVKSPLEKTRYDTSLGLLTKKFVGLLRSAPDGVLDLNKAAEYLEVQKRRIYDITNVLEGINLITKKSKNNIQWKGSNFKTTGQSYNQTLTAAHVDLHSDIADLEAKENQLDQLIKGCSSQLKTLTEDAENSRYAYVTYQDIRGIKSFEEHTVIAIKAPPETRLEVPDPKEKIQIWLKSSKGQIEVFLCPEDAVSPPESSSNIGSGSNTGSSSSCDETSWFSEESSVFSEDSCSRDSFFRGLPSLKNALIEEQDISPENHNNLLMKTEDQNFDTQFEALQPPFSDYMFSLEEGEGISDLFDAFDVDL